MAELSEEADAADVDPRRLPLAIHADRMEYVGWPARRGDTNGSLAWSPGFARYMRPVLPATIEAERRAWREWWTVPYVVDRLRAATARGELPPDALDAVLALHDEAARSGQLAADWLQATARTFRHSREWLIAMDQRVTRLVRSRYLPHRRRDGPPLERSARAERAEAREPDDETEDETETTEEDDDDDGAA